MVSRIQLVNKWNMMPNRKSARVYRRNAATDQIESAADIPNIEKRQTRIGETQGSDGPNNTRACTFHLWASQLVWDFRKGDILEVDGEQWYVKGATLELADTRWKVECTESETLPYEAL